MNNNSGMSECEYISYDDIVPVKCPMDEQETSVAFYRDDDKLVWYTSDNTMVTIFKKRVKESPNLYKIRVASYDEDGNPVGYFVEMPRDLLSFRARYRDLSEEQREKVGGRLKEYHKNKKKQVDN